MDKGCPDVVEKSTPESAVEIIISRTPNCPFVPSKKRLPKVMAGASAAMKRYLAEPTPGISYKHHLPPTPKISHWCMPRCKMEDRDFWKLSGVNASVQSLQ